MILTPSTTSFKNRLQKVWKHFSKLAKKQQISCFRFYDHDLPEAPFAIEWLDGKVHASEYRRRHGMDEERHEQWLTACQQIICDVVGISERDLFIKQRQRKAGRRGQYDKFNESRTEHIVHEGGLSFILNLSDYLDTGLFLDHRITRQMVRDQATDKRVLNLFCYTGSFSVYAALGHAATITSVDMSKTYINWAKRNMLYNKLLNKDTHHFVQEDALEWLQDQKPNSFDLIVCDPPTFSNSKRMDQEWDVQRDHAMLLQQLLYILSPGGQIFFSNNYREFKLDIGAIPASSIRDITHLTTPFDFEGRLNRVCFLINK